MRVGMGPLGLSASDKSVGQGRGEGNQACQGCLGLTSVGQGRGRGPGVPRSECLYASTQGVVCNVIGVPKSIDNDILLVLGLFNST